MSNFAENLRRIMFEKRLKAAQLAKGTQITPSVISRYLSGKNQPSVDNIMTIGNYLGIHPQSLLNSSNVLDPIQSSQDISSTESLLKVVEVQGELIKNLQKQVNEWEEWKASSKERHAKGKAISKNKQKVGFLKKHKQK